MKFDYAFPALVTAVPSGLRAPRRVAVTVEDSVELSEVREDDLPLVADIVIDGRRYAYRYRDGDFYLAAGNSGNIRTVTRTDGMIGRSSILPSFPALRLEVDMLAEAGVVDGSVPPPWPRGLELALRQLANHRGTMTQELASGVADLLTEVERPSRNHEGVGPSGIAHWRDRARETVGRNVVVDGTVFTRVPEPIMIVSPESAVGMKLADISMYEGRFDRYATVAKPFGRGNPGGSGFWNPTCRVIPLSDGERLDAWDERRRSYYGIDRKSRAGGSDKLRVVVHEPAVFGGRYLDLETDRQARLAVAYARSVLFDKIYWRTTVPASVKAAYADLRQLVRFNLPASLMPEAVPEALEALAVAWKEGTALGRQDVIAEMLRVVGEWRERPISLDEAPCAQAGPRR